MGHMPTPKSGVNPIQAESEESDFQGKWKWC